MNKSLGYLFLNFVRRLPNKALIAMITWFLLGVGYNKFKGLKTYYYYRVKEREDKRKFLFEFSCKNLI